MFEYTDGNTTVYFYEDGTYMTPNQYEMGSYSKWKLVDGNLMFQHMKSSGEPEHPDFTSWIDINHARHMVRHIVDLITNYYVEKELLSETD